MFCANNNFTGFQTFQTHQNKDLTYIKYWFKGTTETCEVMFVDLPSPVHDVDTNEKPPQPRPKPTFTSVFSLTIKVKIRFSKY